MIMSEPGSNTQIDRYPLAVDCDGHLPLHRLVGPGEQFWPRPIFDGSLELD